MIEWARLAGTLAFVAWAIPLARIDFREHRLPDTFTLPAYPVAGATIAVLAPHRLGIAATLSVMTLVSAYIAHRVADLGWGDVKLLGSCALLVSLGTDPIGSAAATAWTALVLGGIHAAIHLAVTRDRTAHIPLGPSILVATAFALLRG